MEPNFKLEKIKPVEELINDYSKFNQELKNEVVQEKNIFIETVIPNSEKYEIEIEKKKLLQAQRKEYLLNKIFKLGKRDLTELDKYYLSEAENGELEIKYKQLKESKKSFFKKLIELFI